MSDLRSMSSLRRLRERGLSTAAVALAVALASGDAWAQPAGAVETVAITVDNAKVIRLPAKAQTVIVGNPMIADVAMQKHGVVILTGKSFGTTNLIALDGTGAMLAESMISVQAPQTSIVVVERGPGERNSYSCTPNCQPSMQLGDAPKYFSDVSGQAEARRALATGR